jgi:hypothetical protein
MQRASVIAAVVVVGLVAAGLAMARPDPRPAAPLALDGDGIDRPTVIRDRRGRPILSNVRTVEPGVLYRGSSFPTSFPKAGGETEYADETAFEFLRSLNVRHVLVLTDTPEKYYSEDGYLRFWSGKTGFAMETTWVQIDPTQAFGRDDRGGLRAAGILIALMKEGAGKGGAVYVHDLDGVNHVGVAAAGYELWRNRGWNDFDTTWTLVERRFLAGNRTMQELQREGRAPDPVSCPSGLRAHVCRESLNRIRDDLRFVIEL